MIDTVFALSSGSPPAAIAIVRISGPAAFAAATAIAGLLPEPGRPRLRLLRDPRDGEPLDRALVLTFAAPASATGEDVVELHCHGGRAVVRAIEAALAEQPAVRAAEPGEFTRRALANGRIDLTEAEGLADLLTAETEAQRRAALTSAEGGLRRRVEEWGVRTVALAAAIEAAIDHDDEDADEAAIISEVQAGTRDLAGTIAATIAQPPSERLHEGVRVVLAGPPNSGKSSLFNVLVDRDAAIVSAIPGTTRDRVEATIVRDGVVWVMTDTAGLRDATDDAIEVIGIRRARDAIADADIVLWLDDAVPPVRPSVLALHSRCDLAGREGAPPGRLRVSAVTGEGMSELLEALGTRAKAMMPRADALSLNRRQIIESSRAAAALTAARDNDDPLLIAEHLRQAMRAFDRLTGRADVEAMLDALFSRFCIGK